MITACVCSYYGVAEGWTRLVNQNRTHEDEIAVASAVHEPQHHNIDSIAVVIITNAATPQRFQSLKRLVTSLLEADYSRLPKPTNFLTLRINMDVDTMPEAVDYLMALEWPYGPKTINHRMASAGLIAAVAESWFPSTDNEAGLLLEDDTEVSPLYFEWIHNAIMAATASEEDYDPRLAGISLYTPRRVEVHKSGKYKFDPSRLMNQIAEDSTSPYLHQLPCSWGALYFGEHWKIFSQYMASRIRQEKEREHQVESIRNVNETSLGAVVNYMGLRGDSRELSVKPPLSSTPGWTSSWKKFMIEIMYVHGWYMLYPSFPDQVSFSTNHLEIGEHIQEHDPDHLAEDYTVPLFQPKHKQIFEMYRQFPIEVPPIKTLPILDLLHTPFADLDYLSALRRKEPAEEMEQASVAKSKEGYRYSYWSSSTADIVTVPVNSDKGSGPRGLFWKQQRENVCKDYNSQTNSLLSWSKKAVTGVADHKLTLLLSTFDRFDILEMQIKYYSKSPRIDMILVTWHDISRAPPPPMRVNGVMVEFLPQAKDSLNNRFLPSMKITTEAVLIMDDDMKVHWDDVDLLLEAWASHQDNIVGFYPRRIDTATGKYNVNGADRWDAPYELMLTKVMVLHKRFLEAYSCEASMSMVHKIVDESTNCEDIAMNFVVSSLTSKAAPLFVEPLHYVGDFGDSRYTNRAGVKGSIHQSRSSTNVSHVDIRTACYRSFSDVFEASNGLPDQSVMVRTKNALADGTIATAPTTSRTVVLEVWPMRMDTEANLQNGSVQDFTSTCAFIANDANETVQTGLHDSTTATYNGWKVINDGGSEPRQDFLKKMSNPEEACNFVRDLDIRHQNERRNTTLIEFVWGTDQGVKADVGSYSRQRPVDSFRLRTSASQLKPKTTVDNRGRTDFGIEAEEELYMERYLQASISIPPLSDQPTPAPTPTTDPPKFDPCFICPGDEQVTNPDHVIDIPNQSLKCGELQSVGRAGLIEPGICLIAEGVAPLMCGCGIEATPTESSAPSQSPSRLPSSTPSYLPTEAPSSSHGPSSLPSTTPSIAPTSSALPSSVPSSLPSQVPSEFPSDFPSEFPSSFPSKFPSGSSSPSCSPSTQPSSSSLPSDSPTRRTSFRPTQSTSPSSSPSNRDNFLRAGVGCGEESEPQFFNLRPSSAPPTQTSMPTFPPTGSGGSRMMRSRNNT